MNALTIILFIIGFFTLIKGADLLVEGASSFGRKLGMSQLMIGLTIVAFGTSAPELFVNVLSAMQGTTELALGNILGSNIANILLILGCSALIYPISVSKSIHFKEIPFALLAAVMVAALAIDTLGGSHNLLSFNDGIVLFGFFSVYLYYIITQARSSSKETTDSSDPSMNSVKVVAWIIIGLTGLILGGKWIVDGATVLAGYFGMSEQSIGLTIVAIGTSLPELATSIVAAIKKKSDLIIGNVIGSNIFNTFWILGITSIVSPIAIPDSTTVLFIINIAITALLIGILGIVNKHRSIHWWHGILFLALYIGTIIISFVQ